MQTLTRNKGLFITLSILGLSCLVGAFASPLEKLIVFSQSHKGLMNSKVEEIFVITENTKDYPYGFNENHAIIKAEITQDAKLLKIFLLGLALVSSGGACVLSQSVCDSSEIETEVKKIESAGTKELLVNRVKNKFALMNKTEQLEAMSVFQEMVNLYQGDVTQDADEINATDKFTNAHYLLAEGHDIDDVVSKTWGHKKGTEEHTVMKEKFIQWQEN